MTSSSISRRQLPTQRSDKPFCPGACTLVRVRFSPVAVRKAMRSASNFESWSKMAMQTRSGAKCSRRGVEGVPRRTRSLAFQDKNLLTED